MRFSDLRRNIALVSQDPVLFNESLLDNLLLGHGRKRTVRRLIAAAMNAHAHDFIAAFPQGYDTPAGEPRLASIRRPESSAWPSPGLFFATLPS